jgi:beta-galactosidase
MQKVTRINMFLAFVGIVIINLSGCNDNPKIAETTSFNYDWKFLKSDAILLMPDSVLKMCDPQWEDICLPHSASVEPSVMKDHQWTGICWYKKVFTSDVRNRGKHIAILFEAAMNDATIWLNGNEIQRHLGGYLPFYLDISDHIRFGLENTLLIRLDNRDNPVIPPGKPLKDLDFNYYSGIYRNAFFIVKDRLHFTNPMEIDDFQGGGIIVHTENASAENARLSVNISIRNQDFKTRKFKIECRLKDSNSNPVASVNSEISAIASLSSLRVPLVVKVSKPQLWSPGSPYLYSLETRLVENGKCIETENTPIGIREINISSREGFIINGKQLNIRGTNRHQEYPYIGNALSDNAQYRDAWKIKKAGFNFVRSSHYPQSPAFLNACDELGILVMNSTPGWQFFGDSAFRRHSYQNIREMCRRDRNHPSVIMWEASLNETNMPVDFIRESHKIVHDELPFQDIYTCGWIDTIYDVFMPARQQAATLDYWKKYGKNKPLFIAEYGDWEYYAQNAGLNQTEFRDLRPAERSSRQLRAYGERRLLQQAYNFQESFNDNLYGPAFGSAIWVMFDYNRGYDPSIESSGIMDIFRIPKFSYWFFKSQSDDEPVCFIASFNTPASAQFVRVFSNGDSVALYRNGVRIATRRPDENPNTNNLIHPPFTFVMKSFKAGTLRAESFKNGKLWSEFKTTTAGEAAGLKLEADFSNRILKADEGDIIFIHASVRDKTGNIVNDSPCPVHFTFEGDAMLIGDNPVMAEAGIASILLKAGKSPGKILVKAESGELQGDLLDITAGSSH